MFFEGSACFFGQAQTQRKERYLQASLCTLPQTRAQTAGNMFQHQTPEKDHAYGDAEEDGSSKGLDPERSSTKKHLQNPHRSMHQKNESRKS